MMHRSPHDLLTTFSSDSRYDLCRRQSEISMLKRFVHILLVLLCTSSFAWCDPGNGNGNGRGGENPHKKNKQGRSRPANSENGVYKITIAGTFRGVGSATVTEDSVSFDVDVITKDGSGKFTASSLTTDGPYFSGTGTAIGQIVSIQGRLDAGKASRLTATYTGANGESGRIVGTLPPSSAAP